MDIINFLVIFFTAFSLASGTSKIVLVSSTIGSEPVTFTDSQCDTGAVFGEQYDFSCACVTGLWALYEENCEQAKILIGGSAGQCTPINFKIRKVNRLSPLQESPTVSSATVFDKDLTSIGDRFVSLEGTQYISPGFPVIITTGEQSWRLPAHKKCLKPSLGFNSTVYCIFNHNIEEEYGIDSANCLDEDELVAPLKCLPYMQQDEMNPKICSGRSKQRVRRQVTPGAIQGRALMDAINNLQDPNANKTSGNITEEDENSQLKVMASQPILNSELWNYMTLRAQERLGIRQRRSPSNKDESYSPSLSFLNIAKKVQQKNCPEHYVTDAHYDVAVGAFSAIQRNFYKFTDVFVDFASAERIEEALNACLANITDPYPFIERIGDPNASAECNDSKPVAHGTYYKFNEMLELAVRQDLASRNNEPIIETVWKVFIHTHSHCYPFFKNNYNDHHRFTTIMLSLFTNDMNDLWFNVTQLEPDIYSGFLGNAVDLMDSVAYCSLFSRLESTYPWDLPRPKKFNARRKREAEKDNYQFQCLGDSDARNTCRPDDFPSGAGNDDDDGNTVDYVVVEREAGYDGEGEI